MDEMTISAVIMALAAVAALLALVAAFARERRAMDRRRPENVELRVEFQRLTEVLETVTDLPDESVRELARDVVRKADANGNRECLAALVTAIGNIESSHSDK